MQRGDDGRDLLARALLTLGRREESGEVVVDAPGGRRARIELVKGAIVSVQHVEGSAQVLGDLLTFDGSVAPEFVLDDDGREVGEPIGRFLVRTGRATAGAVAHALRRQARRRLRALFAWERPRVGFRASVPTAGTATQVASAEGVRCADAVVDALRANEDVQEPVVTRMAESERIALSALGRELVSTAALRPEESAIAALLEVPRTVHEVHEAVGGNRRALRFLAALRSIRAVDVVGASGSYSLLLRKRQEIRRNRDARTLLDLGRDASAAESRKALRQLARELHPDRFANADAASRALSAEVLKALVRAQAELEAEGPKEGARRTSGTPRPGGSRASARAR